MFISVIINNYNYEKYLREAIESVLSQTYQEFELIIVDDGSNDNSPVIIEEYAGKFPHKITPIYKQNGGQGSTFNAGFERAKGEIIAFLDSDDYWYPTKLEKIVQEHIKGADLVEHGMDCTGDFCRWTVSKELATETLKQNGDLLQFSETSSLSFKRSILDSVFPIPEEKLKICTETYLLLELVYFSPKITTIKEALSYYRIHDKNNYTNNKNADKGHYVKFVNIFNEKLKQLNLPLVLTGEERIKFNVMNFKFNRDLKYAVYGLGRGAEIVKEHMSKNNLSPIFFVDSNFELRNIENNIFHYTDLGQLEFDSLLIASSYAKEIKQTLAKLNINQNKIVDLYGRIVVI